MKRRHLTLKGSMIAIAVIGVGMAALARPNKLWAFVLPPLAMIMYLTSILGILFRRGPGEPTGPVSPSLAGHISS